MEPFLHGDEQIFVSTGSRMEVGDIVVVHDPEHHEKVLVKTVSMIHGDMVELRGINADHSRDSRSFGMVPKAHIIGRLTAIYSVRT